MALLEKGMLTKRCTEHSFFVSLSVITSNLANLTSLLLLQQSPHFLIPSLSQ